MLFATKPSKAPKTGAGKAAKATPGGAAAPRHVLTSRGVGVGGAGDRLKAPVEAMGGRGKDEGKGGEGGKGGKGSEGDESKPWNPLVSASYHPVIAALFGSCALMI